MSSPTNTPSSCTHTPSRLGVTLGYFPILVILAYLADIGAFSCFDTKPAPLPKGKIIQIGDDHFKKYSVEEVLKSLNEVSL